MNDFDNIWSDICDDLRNDEHVDGAWIKDTFDLAGYSIVKHEKIDKLEKIKTLYLKMNKPSFSLHEQVKARNNMHNYIRDLIDGDQK